MERIMKYIIVFAILFVPVIWAQELNCTITVNMDNITPSNRDLLSDFQQNISDYMNKTRFTNQDWQGGKIDCGLNIFFMSGTSDGNYTAQVVVTSMRPIYQTTKNSLMLSINDPMWSFNYQKGQALLAHQSTFDPVASFLDYYAYMIIGFDADSWQEFGGSPYFNEAIDIANLGSVSQFSKGWAKNTGSYTRSGLVENLLNDKYRPFREAFYQYYYGIDIFQKNKKIGQEKIVYLIKTLQQLKDKIDFSSPLIKTFFDAKSGEIVEYLKDYPDKSIFNILRQVDPSHTAKYVAAMEG